MYDFFLYKIIKTQVIFYYKNVISLEVSDFWTSVYVTNSNILFTCMELRLPG